MKLFNFFKKNNNRPNYKCSCCGQVYDGIPLCFGYDFPDYYFSVPSDEREKRIELEQSLCVVDKKYFFHRGTLTIPIIDYTENLIFNVWTSISEDNFRARIDLWNDQKRTEREPYFGWLQTLVPTYGNTLSVKTIAMEQEVGLIPTIQIIEDNHPLKVDQENGITYKKAIEMVDKILREQHQKN